MQLVIDNKWIDDGLEGSSGVLRNPRKPYFFQFIADAIRDINAQHDMNGILYAWKAMIWSGISLELDGAWTV